MTLLCASFSVSVALLIGPPQQAEGDRVEELVQQLVDSPDDTDLDPILELAEIRTPEALEGLIRAYEAMNSLYMRRGVILSLALYDDVDGVDQRALQYLMDIATEASEIELRRAAVNAIAGCQHLGKAFLTMIVESSADENIRELALLHHTGTFDDEYLDWYREIYQPSVQVKARKASKKASKEERAKLAHRIPALRRLAFEGLAPRLPIDDVIAATEDADREIRLCAVRELDSRDDAKTAKAARAIYDRADESDETRVIAARILVRHEGPKMGRELIGDGTRKDVTREFSLGLANIVADIDDKDVRNDVVRKLGKGQAVDKLFFANAAARIEDPRVDKALVKLAEDKDADVRRAAVEFLGRRGDPAFAETLESVLTEDEDETVASAALESICRLRGSDDEWLARLADFAHSERELVRNAALIGLANTGANGLFGVLRDALEHEAWSTRLVAAKSLADLRTPSAIGVLCQRIAQEQGRMELELSELLWSLTGKPFGRRGQAWAQWWKDEGSRFEVPSPEEIAKLERAREIDRLKDVTRSEFFGIRVTSHRVIFILDVSGSMGEPLEGRFVGEKGEARMEVARREILRALKGLEVESLFNVVTFSSDVDAWHDRISERTTTSVEEASDFVSRILPFGGTNMFGAIEFAFDDPQVDTIYILSDGEPTAGAITDPAKIRDAVSGWNTYRGVTIHCIAIGSRLRTLEWLAQDSGGEYVEYH